MPQKTYNDVIVVRNDLIRQAKLDTRKWCVAPDSIVGRRHSDQYWLQQFSSERPAVLDAKLAHRFLKSFQLMNRVSWDTEQVASAISALTSACPRHPVNAIITLASDLRKSNKRGTRQTSAASKIAMFAFPAAQIFIWDALAARSAKARDWHRDGRRTSKPSTSIFRNAEGEHDYAAHHASCARALVDELAQNDFRIAVADIDRFLQGIGGPMANRALIPPHFVERRLLDKLMFWEGWFMKKGNLPPI